MRNEKSHPKVASIGTASQLQYTSPRKLPPFGRDALNNRHPQSGSIVMFGRDGWRTAHQRNSVSGITSGSVMVVPDGTDPVDILWSPCAGKSVFVVGNGQPGSRILGLTRSLLRDGASSVYVSDDNGIAYVRGRS